MPHKHKRKHGEVDSSTHDLPPSSRAKTLPVQRKVDPVFTSDIENKRKFEARRQRKDEKRALAQQNKSSDYRDDDTPKAFKRLMMVQEGKKMRSGLDDGTKISKKRKQKAETQSQSDKLNIPSSSNEKHTTSAPASKSTSTTQPSSTSALKIHPSESLSTFSQRVDHSLPLSSVPKHSTKLPCLSDPSSTTTAHLKQPLTKHNKRLARMQKDWRATDARQKEKDEALADEELDKKEEDTLLWLGAGIDPALPVAVSRKKKRKGTNGALAPDDVDPWKVLEKKRREEGEIKQRNLQDVVTAPPVLKPLKNIFKIKDEHKRNGLERMDLSGALMT